MGKKKLKAQTALAEFQMNIELPGERKDFYRVDEHVERRGRHLVYKNGPSFIEHQFRNSIAKYVCGFMNSGKNCTLMIGVDGAGIVTGIYVSHYEMDTIRRDIDGAISDVKPEVHTEQCNVKFVPIYNTSGTSQIRDLWVIEIDVAGVENKTRDQLYESNQGVFIKGKDNSLEGPLSAQMIQEWTKRHFKAQMDMLRQSGDTLRQELSNTQTDYTNKDKQLQQKSEELARRERAIHNLEQNMKQFQTETNDLVVRNRQLQAENTVLKTSGDDIRKEIREIKFILNQRPQKQSRACIIL